MILLLSSIYLATMIKMCQSDIIRKTCLIIALHSLNPKKTSPIIRRSSKVQGAEEKCSIKKTVRQQRPKSCLLV